MADLPPSSWVVLRPYPYGGGGNLAFAWSLSKFGHVGRARICVDRGESDLSAFADPSRLEVVRIETSAPGAGLNHLARIERLTDLTKGAGVIDFPEAFTACAAQSASYAERHGIPAISTVLETLSDTPLTRLPHVRRFRRIVAKSVHHFRTFTERARRALVSAGFPEDRIHRIPVGVDTESFRPGSFRAGSEGPKLLFARRLESKNGVAEFLEAVKLLRAEIPELTAYVAGNGPLARLVERAERRGLVRRLGWVPYAQLPELYRSADVFVNPAKDRRLLGATVQEDGQYTFPLLEAQSTGLGVVTTASGANGEIVAPGNIVVSQGSVRELAEGIVRAIDPASLRRRGEANRRFVVDRFDALSWQAVADRHVEQILSETGP